MRQPGRAGRGGADAPSSAGQPGGAARRRGQREQRGDEGRDIGRQPAGGERQGAEGGACRGAEAEGEAVVGDHEEVVADVAEVKQHGQPERWQRDVLRARAERRPVSSG